MQVKDIVMTEGNNLIIPRSNEVTFGNGLSIQESRGKKDCIWGACIKGQFEGRSVLYPTYGADDLILMIDDIAEANGFHIVKSEDIIMHVPLVKPEKL